MADPRWPQLVSAKKPAKQNWLLVVRAGRWRGSAGTAVIVGVVLEVVARRVTGKVECVIIVADRAPAVMARDPMAVSVIIVRAARDFFRHRADIFL